MPELYGHPFKSQLRREIRDLKRECHKRALRCLKAERERDAYRRLHEQVERKLSDLKKRLRALAV